MSASRTKKARRSGTCPLCRAATSPGQYIARYEQIRGWVHVTCAARRCDTCGQRLPLARIAAGATTHPMCKGLPE